tara:strand:- start:2063 stop:3451 length:1389 start_codon:yes stop_codon:yes gene_type:complete
MEKKLNNYLKERVVELESLAKDMGLDWYQLSYEMVPIEVMLEVMSYGLPTRARHWKYGQSYEYQKYSGEMGASKVYELVLNNDPSYAFLLDTNPDIANIMVSAHVIGHSHFFKNNYLFKKTDNKMVYRAAERAQRIDDYINIYGLEKVENIMNIGFSIEKNIDFHKGIYRKKLKKESNKIFINGVSDEFDDLLCEKDGFSMSFDSKFPSSPEYDLLWFLANYSKIEEWEKDILSIIREESFYFFPNYYTKIMNEGFASYCHSELMQKVGVSAAEFLEYSKIHERVVQSGSNKMNINPYFLGFRMLHDIKDRWDEKHKNGDSDIDGWQKILSVVNEEDDISFIRNYLTKELCEDLELFVYRVAKLKNGDKILEIESKDLDDIKENLTKDIYNYRSPVIYVNRATKYGLELVHENTKDGSLDPNHMREVLKYIYSIWKSPVDLQTVDSKGKKMHITYDSEGCSI